MQATATSRWIVVNSYDSDATLCVNPASASPSNPSTSILMNAGSPCAAISASSVVTGTSTEPSQIWSSQPAAPCAASTNAADAVETVGLAVFSLMVSVPLLRPTALASMTTSER